MYINLGNIYLNYISDTNDFMILSEIPDSTLSYEKPILVRSIDELDIWFGKTFASRNYFEELIKQGIVLYLYKPISEKSKEYIDLDTYKDYQEEKKYSSINELPEAHNVNIKYLVTSIDTYAKDGVTYNAETETPLDESFYYCWVTGKGYIHPDKKSKAHSIYEVMHYESENQLPSHSVPGYKYFVGDSIYISLYDDINKVWYWISEKDLPQNTGNQSVSLDNRDTLLITRPGENIPAYCYPEYETGQEHLGVFSHTAYKTSIDIENFKIEDNQTLAFKIQQNSGTTGYAVINNPGNNGQKTIFLGNIEVIPEELRSKFEWEEVENIKSGFSNYIVEDNIAYCNLPVDITEFYNLSKNSYIQSDFRTTQNIITQSLLPYSGLEMWSKTIGKDKDLYDDSGLIKVLIEKTAEDYIYRFTLTRYEYSETIEGSIFPDVANDRIDHILSRESKLINCNILNLKTSITPGKYKINRELETKDFIIRTKDNLEHIIKISKKYPDPKNFVYDFEIDDEFWTGDIFEGIDISESKILESITFKDLCKELRTGEFILRSAEREENTEKMYWKSLDIMLDQEDIYPDYFLIPNIKNYIEDLEKTSHDKYKKFLEYAESINMQVLIQNNGPRYTLIEMTEIPEIQEPGVLYKVTSGIETHYYLEGKEITDKEIINTTQAKGDYIYNFLADKDNRLLYFYKPMLLNGLSRPAYYMYVRGLLEDIYSISVKYINYDSPVANPYEKSVEQLEKNLRKYKSNYLMYNNQEYYYKDYINGDKYNTTGWMRFAIGKISRELIKNKGKYLGERSISKITNAIFSILNKTQNSFPIIDDIELTDLIPNLQENKITLTIDAKVNDLVNNNISLEITINYIK